jgi:hypothetical protein
VDGLLTQEKGDVPFFFMDAHEAPERPGVYLRMLVLWLCSKVGTHMVVHRSRLESRT